ncbi:CIS tube protein [Terricaulis silvestris]|uniref:Contractile injection system tube protein N-terminal domain-containing protein n=1 Tax=Terricaulis silvestris TaxID=2686094 RepID=A0A6I6MQV3_9CAUL|nr:hypothetical protein [Terricaulis silvestris]QGZ93962.1 hypothetical protein DSM104635_00777 [Terricaulis silvestris]
MKLFALLFAFLTVACAIDALMLPALAQQTVRAIPPSAMKGVSTTPAPVTNTDLQPTQTPVTDGAGEPPVADEERPPPVRFIWSGQGRGAAPSVVDSIEEKYTMFLPDGAPVRAAAEADVSGKSKSGDGAIVQGPTSTDQQTYRPSEFRIDNDDEEDDDSD